MAWWKKLTLNRVRGRSYWLFDMIDIKIQRNHHQKIKNKKIQRKLLDIDRCTGAFSKDSAKA